MINTDSDTGPYTCEGLLVINLVARSTYRDRHKKEGNTLGIPLKKYTGIVLQVLLMYGFIGLET